jgi:hypothetical protein
MLYRGIVPHLPGLKGEPSKSFVKEIAEDVWMLEEYLGSGTPLANFRKAMTFLKWPNRNNVLVAAVLKKAGVPCRQRGNRLVFQAYGSTRENDGVN